MAVMIIQAPGMGMENRRHTDVSPQLGRVQAKVFQGAGRAIEQDVVNSGWVAPGEGAQFVRQGKRHHEVLDRQQFGELAVQPL